MLSLVNERFFDTFGKRVKVLREDLRLTQEDLRQHLVRFGVEIGQSYLSEIERSKKMPNGEVIVGLAKALRTNADYLLMLTDNADPHNGATAVSIVSEDAEERRVLSELVELAQEVTRPDQNLLLEIVRRFRASHSPRVIGGE